MPSGVRVRFARTTSCEPSGDRAMIAGGRACRTYSVPPLFVATVSTLHQVSITVVVLAESMRRPAAAEPFPTDYRRLCENFVTVVAPSERDSRMVVARKLPAFRIRQQAFAAVWV